MSFVEMLLELEERVEELRAQLADLDPDGDPMERVTLLCEIGSTYAEGGQNAAALSATLESLQCLSSECAAHLPAVSVLHLKLAHRFLAVGQSEEALRLYHKAVDLLAQTHGPDADAVWIAREQIGVVALSKGDTDRARQEFDAVLEVRRRNADGDWSTEVRLVGILLQQARLARMLGQPDLAEGHVSEAKERAEALMSDELLADVLDETGALATAQGQSDRAIKAYELAHGIRAIRLGQGHPKTLISLIALSEAYPRAGRMDDARSVLKDLEFHRGHELPGRLPVESALPAETVKPSQFEVVAAPPERESIEREATYRLSESTFARNEVFAAMRTGNASKAVRLAVACVAEAVKGWEATLRYGSETDRHLWHSMVDALSACAAVAPHDPEPMFRAALRFKGAVAASMAEDRPQFQSSELASELEAARATLRKAELDSTSDEAVLAKAREDVERLESRITINRARPLGLKNETSHETLRKVVGADRALVEFIQFSFPDETGLFRRRLGALVILASSSTAWVDLGIVDGPDGIAAQIATLIGLLRSRLLPSDSEFLAAASAVQRTVWAPIGEIVGPQVSEIIIAPDGCLNLVSFATLWTASGFLGEAHRFRYVTSGGRLTGEPPADNHPRRGVIVAAPDFDHAPRHGNPMDGLRRLGKRTLDWIGLRGGADIPDEYPRLPGTWAEGERLSAVWREHGLSEVTFFSGAEASKGNVAGIKQPWLLHFATHGHYVEGSGLPENPMLRSWLALAGANRTLARWREGNPPDDLDDGLLRADEVRSMDLAGTQLVALSACDSGVGAIRSSEGVFGMRRAFHEAGARHLLLTLWPVNDERTAEFMPEFYRRLLAGADPVKALHDVQGSWLGAARRSMGPAAAARLFGPFVISA